MKALLHGDFSIGYPEGWLDVSTITIAGMPQNDYSPSITVTRDFVEEGVTAAEYADIQLADLSEAFTEQQFTILREGEISISGDPAFERHYCFVLEDDESGATAQIQQWQVYLVFGVTVIIITCTDLATTFERSYETFAQAVNNFRYHGA